MGWCSCRAASCLPFASCSRAGARAGALSALPTGPYARRPSHELRQARRARFHTRGNPGGARGPRDRADRDRPQPWRGDRHHRGAARSHPRALGRRGQVGTTRIEQGVAGSRREGGRRRHGRARVPLAPGDGRDARRPHAARRSERVPPGNRFDAGKDDRIPPADRAAVGTPGGAIPMNSRARASGFTLIELLVALVIFGIFSVLAYARLGRWLDAPLLADVETFELGFLGATGDPVDTWPTATSGPDVPPRAMEVTLAVKGVGRFKRLFLVNS